MSTYGVLLVAQHHAPGRGEDAAAAVPKGIDELQQRYVWLHLRTLGLSERRGPRGMQGKHQHHRGGRWRMKRYVISDTDQHKHCTVSLTPKNLPLSFAPHYTRE